MCEYFRVGRIIILTMLAFFFSEMLAYAGSPQGEQVAHQATTSIWPLVIIIGACFIYRFVRPGQKHDSLGTIFLGIVGVTLVIFSGEGHHFTVVQETLLLVVFLAGLMGVAPIKFPTLKKMWGYPIMAGCLSALMDSFLVLLVVARMTLDGDQKEQRKFKIYCTLAALIGGLMIYFGEVFALPVYLDYGMKSPTDTVPIIPPAMLFLCVLAFFTSRLKVAQGTLVKSDAEVIGSSVEEVVHGEPKDLKNPKWNQYEDYAEFLLGIALLLSTHNALLCLGALLLYAAITGQGEDFIEIMKTDLEVEVMLLLVFAALIESRAEPWLAWAEGYMGLLAGTINAVIFGALKTKSGDVWFDITIVSTSALILPISSLVGVMIFKTKEDWKEYVKYSIPFAALWMGICLGWFKLIYPMFA